MGFEYCFSTSVPIFAGNTVVPGHGPAKHGDDPTPYERSGARDLSTEMGLDPLRTRSVRRASGLLDTALGEIGISETIIRRVNNARRHWRTGRGPGSLNRATGTGIAGPPRAVGTRGAEGRIRSVARDNILITSRRDTLKQDNTMVTGSYKNQLLNTG